MKKILILGSNNNAALSIAQDLGDVYEIYAFGFQEDFNKVEYSKHLKAFKNVSKRDSIKTLTDSILDYVNTKNIEVIIPTNDRFTFLMSLSDVRENISNIIISTPEYDMLIKGMDKFESTQLVGQFGLKIPKTYTLNSFDAAEYPVYMKSRLSWMIKDDKFESGSVKKIKSHNEFLEIKNELKNDEIYIQEEVSGVGWGLEILAKNGELLNYFAHERIRESNPKGGYSSVAMSIYPNLYYVERVKEILKELNWTGVAMFEFKGDYKEKNAYFIEMNCRFWGSLPVALHSGNRFPHLLLKVLKNEPVEQINYKEHVLAQWYQADIIHFFKILTLKNRSQYNFPSVFSTFKGVFFSKMKNYNKYNGDWKPEVYELTKGFIQKVI